jgi:hypothetical protein
MWRGDSRAGLVGVVALMFIGRIATAEADTGAMHTEGHMYLTPIRAAASEDSIKALAIASSAKTAMAPYQDYPWIIRPCLE